MSADRMPEAEELRVSHRFTRLHILFFDSHGDLRVPWRLALFLLLASVCIMMLTAPVVLLLPGVDLAAYLMLVIALLLASWVMTRFVNKKPLGAIGVGIHWRAGMEFGLGSLLGFLMMAGIFLIQYALGYITIASLGLAWGDLALRAVAASLVFLLAAASEELLFRGYAFQTLMQGITFLPAAVVVSLLFGLSHLANPHASLFAAVNVAVAGLWLSFAYLKTRSLWLPIGLHASWNFSQTTLFSLPTSGLEFLERRLYQTTVSGPEWITGGAFGPEGGILATIALIACTWYILKSSMLTRPEGIVTLDSLEDVLPPPVVAEEE